MQRKNEKSNFLHQPSDHLIKSFPERSTKEKQRKKKYENKFQIRTYKVKEEVFVGKG